MSFPNKIKIRLISRNQFAISFSLKKYYGRLKRHWLHVSLDLPFNWLVTAECNIWIMTWTHANVLATTIELEIVMNSLVEWVRYAQNTLVISGEITCKRHYGLIAILHVCYLLMIHFDKVSIDVMADNGKATVAGICFVRWNSTANWAEMAKYSNVANLSVHLAQFSSYYSRKCFN